MNRHIDTVVMDDVVGQGRGKKPKRQSRKEVEQELTEVRALRLAMTNQHGIIRRALNSLIDDARQCLDELSDGYQAVLAKPVIRLARGVEIVKAMRDAAEEAFYKETSAGEEKQPPAKKRRYKRRKAKVAIAFTPARKKRKKRRAKKTIPVFTSSQPQARKAKKASNREDLLDIITN